MENIWQSFDCSRDGTEVRSHIQELTLLCDYWDDVHDLEIEGYV